MSEKDDILSLVNSMNNLPKSKDNYFYFNIENTKNNYEELVKWCEQNCKHPWKGIINSGMWSTRDFTFLFKHDDDATMFKLVWR